MFRPLLLIGFLGSLSLQMAGHVSVLTWGMESVPPTAERPAFSAEDPEIDRSPIWAQLYRKYLYHFGKEMFLPGIGERASFTLGVVGWSQLSEDLGERLDGRTIAGLPIEIIPLEPGELGDHKSDFTLLFLGGTGSAAERSELAKEMDRWNRKGNREAIVITDGEAVAGYDLMFRRLKTEEGLKLCIEEREDALASKGMTLPKLFIQRRCP